MANLFLDETYTVHDYIEAMKADFAIRAPVYDSGANGAMHHNLISRLLCAYPFKSPVLDVACGTGYLCGLVTSQGGTATGLDVSAGMLEEARKRHKEARFVEGRAENLPFQDDTFNSVYVCTALAYFLNIPGTLKEIYRVLAEDGFFAYQASSGDSYVIGIALQEACVRALGTERGGKTFQVPNTVTHSEIENRTLMENAGFKDIRIESYVENSVLETADVERMWTNGLMRNALLGRVKLLGDEDKEKVRKAFVQCIEERRDAEGVLRDKVVSWFVQGWKRK